MSFVPEGRKVEHILEKTDDLRETFTGQRDARNRDEARAGAASSQQTSTEREEARLMRSAGMGMGSKFKEQSRVERHVQNSHGRAVNHGVRQAGPRTAAPTFSLERWRDGVIAAINQARKEPKAYARELEKLRECYQGNRFLHPDGDGASFITEEGVAALEDAIRFFKQMDPVPPIRLSHALSRASQDLAENATLHPDSRLPKYGEARFGKVQEVTSSGYKSPKEIVLHWLLCDGEKQRKIRDAFMSKVWGAAGLGSAKHAQKGQFQVISLCVEFKPKEEFVRHEIFPEGGKGDLGTLGTFFCTDCGSKIPGNFVEDAGKKYHQACWDKNHSSGGGTVAIQCTTCGTKRKADGDKFCSGCGKPYPV